MSQWFRIFGLGGATFLSVIGLFLFLAYVVEPSTLSGGLPLARATAQILAAVMHICVMPQILTRETLDRSNMYSIRCG